MTDSLVWIPVAIFWMKLYYNAIFVGSPNHHKIYPYSSLTLFVWMNKHGWNSDHQLKCPWSQMFGNPQRTFSKDSQPTTASTFHPGAIYPSPSQRIWNSFFCLSLSLSLLRFLSLHSSRPAYPSTTHSIQQWGCLNAQVLFVHSVHTHLCQKERLQCSITALTAREHHRQKPEPFAFYVVFLKFQCLGVGLPGIFRGIYGGFSGLYWRGPISLWDYSTTKWSNEDPN